MLLGTPIDARIQAKHLYWQGYALEQIAELLNVSANTVRSWKSRDGWADTAPLDQVNQSIAQRMQLLIWKEHHTGNDLKVIDNLGRQLERTARVRRFEQPGGHEGDLNPKVANRNAKPKAKPRQNHLTADDVAKLEEAFEQGLFDYQLGWDGARIDLLASSANVTRFILKSRQIGATFYFAREALIRLLRTGNNQIFISASRAQANNFRRYIFDFVFRATGVELKGDPIVLDVEGVTGPEGESPTLYFLGTNYRTAQSYHGDVYIDEVFWIHGFEQIDDVASGMATHERYRITYFSTPSTVAHQAYKRWTGDRYNEGRDKADKVTIDLSEEAMRRGTVGPDGIFRQRVTLLDARAGGCELISVERQQQRYPPDVFANLYLCEFVDDSQSMFPFALMKRAMVDSWDAWADDFDPYGLRPFGNAPVWIGYDPAESAAGDDAALVIVAPPATPGGKFRVLEKHRLKGKDFEEQAAFILKQLDRYRVDYIGIDTTGVGKAVWQLVAKKFPLAKALDYSVPLKTQMVLKAKNVFSKGRIQFDSGANDIAASFMAIRAELTASQRQVTYVASRAGDTGHADLAWAIMHALHNEPLDPTEAGVRKTRVRTFGNGRDDGQPGAGRGERGHRRDRRDAGSPARRRRWVDPGRREIAGLRVRGSGARARSPRAHGLCRMHA